MNQSKRQCSEKGNGVPVVRMALEKTLSIQSLQFGCGVKHQYFISRSLFFSGQKSFMAKSAQRPFKSVPLLIWPSISSWVCRCQAQSLTLQTLSAKTPTPALRLLATANMRSLPTSLSPLLRLQRLLLLLLYDGVVASSLGQWLLRNLLLLFLLHDK